MSIQEITYNNQDEIIKVECLDKFIEQVRSERTKPKSGITIHHSFPKLSNTNQVFPRLGIPARDYWRPTHETRTLTAISLDSVREEDWISGHNEIGDRVNILVARTIWTNTEITPENTRIGNTAWLYTETPIYKAPKHLSAKSRIRKLLRI